MWYMQCGSSLQEEVLMFLIHHLCSFQFHFSDELWNLEISFCLALMSCGKMETYLPVRHSDAIPLLK